MRVLSALGLCLAMVLSSGVSVKAEIVLASGFFSGTIDRYDPVAGTAVPFAIISSGTDPFPGLSGLTYDAFNNIVYASARISNRVYSVNANTGAVLGFHQLTVGSSPASIAVDGTGKVYIANNGSNSISVYNSTWGLVDTINLPDYGLGNNLPSGLAFDSSGDLIISTFAGAGVLKYDTGTGTFASFNANPLANAQIAIDASGDVLIGNGFFGNSVAKFNLTGTQIGSIDITNALLPEPLLPYASVNATQPSGVAVDSTGNIIVAALGRTNPTSLADNFQSNGGLFYFSSSGTLLNSITQTTPYSSVISFSAVPEPTSMGLLALAASSAFVIRRFRLKKKASDSLAMD